MPQHATWLVIGGAGYVGAHVVRVLQGLGTKVSVSDGLSTGKLRRLAPGIKFIAGDVKERSAFEKAFNERVYDGVVHLAGYWQARRTVTEPLTYRRNGFAATIAALKAMTITKVSRLGFSSSCLICRDRREVTPQFPPSPISPCERTKLTRDWLITDAAATHGLNFVYLRWVKASGYDSFPGSVGKGMHDTLPRLIERVRQGEPLAVNGSEFETPEGICLREYIGMRAVANDHAKAREFLRGRVSMPQEVHLPNRNPIQVLEIASTVRPLSPREHSFIEFPHATDSTLAAITCAIGEEWIVLRMQPRITLEDSESSQLIATGLSSK